MARNKKNPPMFDVFNEIGIINQLSTTLFNRRLPDKLHVSHFAVLNHLVRLGDGRTPRELSTVFQVTKGTMSNTLNDLSSRGLIETRPHQSDKRSKLVFLTKAGKGFQYQAIEELLPTLKAIEKNIDVQALLACLPALRQLREVLDKSRNV